MFRKQGNFVFYRIFSLIGFFFLFLPLKVAAYHYDCNDNAWKIKVAPYIWALNMNGRVGVGRAVAHVDQSFSDILKQLNFAGMIAVDVQKNRFGLYGNAIYAILSDEASFRSISAKTHNKFGIFGAGIFYQVWQYQNDNVPNKIILQPYIGLRYTTNITTVTIESPIDRIRDTSNQSWTDPLIGMQAIFHFTNAWRALLGADIGGTNGRTHYSYSWLALLGYHPQMMCFDTTFYLGYRALDQHYETGKTRDGFKRYDWNMKLYGPILGVLFTF